VWRAVGLQETKKARRTLSKKCDGLRITNTVTIPQAVRGIHGAGVKIE
jgi:hypothetical protein